ncbi:MAG: hypothetical protein ACJ8GN_03335 [Longimicrobiaceae bacterium]
MLIRSLPLLALLAAAPAAARVIPSAEASPPTPVGMRVRVDSARSEMLIEVGPVDMAPDGEHHQLPAFHARLPVSGWLRGYRVEMVDGNGRTLPSRMLHHVNLITPEQRELFSPIMLRVGAAGQETGPVMLPRMLGYRFRRGQELIVTSMLHNPTGRVQRGVWMRLRLPYTPADAVIRPMDVLPFYIDVMPPASLHAYDLPPGRSRRSWDARPAIAARILAIGGHVHRYGTALRLEDLTARRVIWEGRPVLGRDGEIAAMPHARFLWKLGIPVRPGHLYRVTAEYDNNSGKTIPGGAMGTVGGVLVPDDASRWPAVDRDSPELKLDWHLVHTGNQGGHMHMHAEAAPAAGQDHGRMPGMSQGAAARPAARADATAGATHAHAHDHPSHR